MKHNIKLAAVDIDGIFVRLDYTYDVPRFKRILSRMKEAGCSFIVASGKRSFCKRPAGRAAGDFAGAVRGVWGRGKGFLFFLTIITISFHFLSIYKRFLIPCFSCVTLFSCNIISAKVCTRWKNRNT